MELFDKLLILRIFCYFQGLWATPKYQMILFKLSTKCFFYEMEQLWGLNLQKIMIFETILRATLTGIHALVYLVMRNEITIGVKLYVHY